MLHVERFEVVLQQKVTSALIDQLLREPRFNLLLVLPDVRNAGMQQQRPNTMIPVDRFDTELKEPHCAIFAAVVAIHREAKYMSVASSNQDVVVLRSVVPQIFRPRAVEALEVNVEYRRTICVYCRSDHAI